MIREGGADFRKRNCEDGCAAGEEDVDLEFGAASVVLDSNSLELSFAASGDDTLHLNVLSGPSVSACTSSGYSFSNFCISASVKGSVFPDTARVARSR